MDETIFLDIIYCVAVVFFAWKNITSWGSYLHELEFNIFEKTDIPSEGSREEKILNRWLSIYKKTQISLKCTQQLH